MTKTGHGYMRVMTVTSKKSYEKYSVSASHFLLRWQCWKPRVRNLQNIQAFVLYPIHLSCNSISAQTI